MQDGGYGWFLTALALLAGPIELGTFKSFGVILLVVQESLQCSVTTLGTVFAAAHTAGYFLSKKGTRLYSLYDVFSGTIYS